MYSSVFDSLFLIQFHIFFDFNHSGISINVSNNTKNFSRETNLYMYFEIKQKKKHQIHHKKNYELINKTYGLHHLNECMDHPEVASKII